MINKLFQKLLIFTFVLFTIFTFDFLILKFTHSQMSTSSFFEFIYNCFKFDWGPSNRYADATVTMAIFANWGTSFKLLLSTFFLSNIIATGLALFCISKVGLAFDFTLNFISYLLICTPVIISSPIIIQKFIIEMDWGQLDKLYYPVIVLTIFLGANYFKYIRLGLRESLIKNFIAAGYAKGLPQKRVILFYALRDGFGAFLSMLPNSIINLFSLVMAVEYIFDLPGIGRFVVQSALNLDYPVVLGMINLCVIVTFTIGIIVEQIQMILIPRLRFSND